MEYLAPIMVICLVISGIGAYLLLMIFYPEWVGISGKSADKTLQEHQEGSVVDDSDIFSSNKSGPRTQSPCRALSAQAPSIPDTLSAPIKKDFSAK
jgi:hypothetical protein